MGWPVVIVDSGGLPVTEAANGLGTPVTVATNGFGLAVTVVSSGGLPVVGSGGVTPATMTRWVAPTAQGTGDGLTSANAGTRADIPTYVSQIAALGATGDIILRADLGAYTVAGTITIAAGNPTIMGNTITIRGGDAAGLPARAILNGSRSGPSNITNAGQIAFLLSPGAHNIRFHYLETNNMQTFCLMRPTLGYNFSFDDITGTNFYRWIDTQWTPDFNNGGLHRVDGLFIDNCFIDYIAQAAFNVRNVRRLRLDGGSANGRDIDQISNAPSGLRNTPCPGDLGQGDTSNDIILNNFFAYGMIEDPTGAFAQGDGLEMDDDSVGLITQLQVTNSGAALNGDGGFDNKSSGGIFTNCVIWNNYINIKDWCRPGYTNIYNDLHTLNPSNLPSVVTADPKRKIHVKMVLNGSAHTFNDWQIYEWDSGSKFPIVRCTEGFVPAPGAYLYDSSANCILEASGSSTGHIANINGYDRMNTYVGINFYRQEDTLSPNLGVTLTFNPALPVVSLTLPPRTNGEFVPQATSVGTVLRDAVFTHDKGAVGVGALSEVSDADGKFSLVGTEIRLQAALNPAVSYSHSAVFRGVYGIVGTDPYNDPADVRTWQCHLGFNVGGAPASYADTTARIYVVATANETEVDAFLAACVTDGVDISGINDRWRTAYNIYVSKLKASGIWTIADILPANFGPTEAIRLRSLKGIHHATKTGTVTSAAKTLWQSDGSTGYLSWATYAPNAGGNNFLQNDASVAVESVTNLQTANTIFSLGSGSSLTSIVPRSTSTQAQYRINSLNGVNSLTITTGEGLWTLSRTGGTAMNVRQDLTSRGTSANASVALTSGIPRLFTNTGVTTFAAHQGALWFLGSSLDLTKITANKALIDEFKAVVADV